MKYLRALFLAIIIILSFSTYGQIIGVVASSGSTSSNNYIFNGDSDAFLYDTDSLSATMLDGVVAQTWVIRMKITNMGADFRGIIGTINGFGQSLNWEIHADNKMDGALRDTGISSFLNSIAVPTVEWATYFLQYDTTNGWALYKNTTSILTNSDNAFTGRDNGRILGVGGTSFSATAYYFDGEMSDIQFYSKSLNTTERSDLVTDITDTTTSLVVNFAGKKSTNIWTSESETYTLTNQGGVTTN